MPGVSRAWVVERYGGPERLVLRERPDPVPGAGEVLFKTAAIGLNFADLFVRAGAYPRTPKPPFAPAWRSPVRPHGPAFASASLRL